MILLDATTLLLFVRPDMPGPKDGSGKPLRYGQRRLEYRIAQLDKQRKKVLIPTPALAEALVRRSATEAQQLIETVNRKSVFRLSPFDQRAAIEFAELLSDELDGRRGKRRLQDGPETWAKLKFDRQIVAIARVNSVSAIYSEDKGVRRLAERVGIPVIRVQDLPLPPEDEQHGLFDQLEDAEEETAPNPELAGQSEGADVPDGKAKVVRQPSERADAPAESPGPAPPV